MLKEILLVGAGGFLGSALRYIVSLALKGITWFIPITASTITVNVTGSLLIGILLSFVGQGNWYFLAVVGFCGGFTTFSAFSTEIFAMAKEGYHLQSIIYILLSVLLCVLAVWIGVVIGTKLLK